MKCLFITLILVVTSALLCASPKGDTLVLLAEQAIPPAEFSAEKKQAEKWMQKQSVCFLENKGQITNTNNEPVPSVLFKASAPGMDMYITKQGLTCVFINVEENDQKEKDASVSPRLPKDEKEEKITTEMAWLDVHLNGASIKEENIIREGESAEHFNFFYGHCPQGIYDVKQYDKITIREVYPGIDWVFYNAKKRGLKYDFIVHPGADPSKIKLLYESEKPLQMNEHGGIEITTSLGTYREDAPYSYIKETNTEIPSSFSHTQIDKHNVEVSFNFPALNSGDSSQANLRTLIIDPALWWATLYGGNGIDGPMSIDTDNNGNLFVTGYLGSTNFPVQTAGNSSNFPVQTAGGSTYYQPVRAGSYDIFILKFSNAGTRLWATHYGGTGQESGYFICTDAADNIFVTGYTTSTDLPIPGAGIVFQPANAGNVDLFILKFDNLGNRLWATYYGGTDSDAGYSITTDPAGNVYVTGHTYSTDLPVQTTGTFFQFANAGGIDAFILKFDNLGNRIWATYYGDTGSDYGFSLATDAAGNVFVAGQTNSSNFPLQNSGTFFQPANAGFGDAFILKFNNANTRQWATYYGGSDDEPFFYTYDNLVIDECSNVYLSFTTRSSNLPVQLSCDAGYNDNSFNGGPGGTDIALVVFNNTGAILWTTYLGGDGVDFREALALDPNNNLFVAGEWAIPTSMGTYPLTDPGAGAYFDDTHNGSDDGYIVKFCGAFCLCSSFKGCTILSATVSPANILCNSQCTGTATVTATGGIAPYTYSWNAGGQTTQTATGLCAGTYTVIVTDAASSSDTAIVTITQPASVFTSTVSFTNVNCNGGNNGTATISAAGGTPSYTYLWTQSNKTTQVVSGLLAGNHTVTVTDSNGCTKTTTVVITEPAAITITVTTNPASCGNSNGSLTVTPGGGTPGYLYSWSNSQTTQTAIGLAAATYTITITDANLCAQTSQASVSMRDHLRQLFHL